MSNSSGRVFCLLFLLSCIALALATHKFLDMKDQRDFQAKQAAYFQETLEHERKKHRENFEEYLGALAENRRLQQAASKRLVTPFSNLRSEEEFRRDEIRSLNRAAQAAEDLTRQRERESLYQPPVRVDLYHHKGN